MSQKIICPSCGFTASGEETICSNCGEKLSSEINRTENIQNNTSMNLVTCKSCGFKNDPSFNYCGKCGSSLKDIPKKKIAAKSKPKELSQTSISSRLIYIIILLFIFLVVIIFFINRQEKSVPQKPVEQSQTSVPPQEIIPPIDMRVVNELKSRIEKNPSDRNPIIELAHLYHDHNDFTQAITYYGKFLALDGHDADARVDMAVCYFALKDYKTAIAEIEKVLKFSPKHQKAYFNLGIIYLNSGNFSESMKNFEKCSEINPNSEVGAQAKQLLEQHRSAMKNK